MTDPTMDKIIRARVHLMKRYPFFGYLAMYLKVSEEVRKDPKTGKCVLDTMGVDRFANLVYSKEFVDKLTHDELMATLAHEIMHVAQLHLTRLGFRDMKKWNIATDLVINTQLSNNGLQLPQGIVTTSNLKKIGVNIKNPATMSAEEVYAKIDKKIPDSMMWDKHIYDPKGTGGQGNNQSKQGQGTMHKKQFENQWKNRITEAVQRAKQKGQVPAGMDRYIDDLLEPKLSWRELLQKYITKEIPFDYTYMKPHKKSIATGIYMPSEVREGMDLVVTVDTSGSMGDSELKECMAEISSIVTVYPFVRMTVVMADARVNRVYKLTNTNAEEIKKLVFQGGGGTSHIPVYNWLKKNKPDARLVINLTDGYTSFPSDDKGFASLWVITSGGLPSEQVPFGQVIRLSPKDHGQ